MSQDLWTKVDDYIETLFVPGDPVLDDALAASAAAGLPPHNVAPNQGKFLALLAQIQGARRILEIGTLGGYSTIWLARALPQDGQLITLESDAGHAEIARANLRNAGLDKIVELRQGKALDQLRQLVAENTAPFDFIFIDADKPSNPDYLEWSRRLSRPGTIIIGDNVIREGAVADAASNDAKVQGIRRFHDMIAADPQLSATAIQTVGSKGYDGFTLIRVL